MQQLVQWSNIRQMIQLVFDIGMGIKQPAVILVGHNYSREITKNPRKM